MLSYRIHTVASAIFLDRPHLRIGGLLHFLGALLWSFYDYAHLAHLVGFDIAIRFPLIFQLLYGVNYALVLPNLNFIHL